MFHQLSVVPLGATAGSAPWFGEINLHFYISRLCYNASVRLSVTFVHCGHGAMDPGYLCMLG